MKKVKFLGIMIVGMILLNMAFASAVCNIGITMVNQDPYPAVPGEYVKIVFQITGTENPDCEYINFELMNKYPIIFDPGEKSMKEFIGGTYAKDFTSSLVVPYKVRVDKDALDGENEIEVRYGTKNSSIFSNFQTFNLEVQDTKADFELHIDKYSYATKDLTIEILNIADVDVEALTLEIPKQDNVDIRGSNRVVVGDLDSNEYTTADYTANLEDGNINIKLLYTDNIGKRREVIKTIEFDSSYFAQREDEEPQTPIFYYIIGLLIVGAILWWILRKRKKRQHKMRSKGSARLG